MPDFEEYPGTPKVQLQISGDRRTTGFLRPSRSMGKKGEYKTRVVWRRLGQYRTFVPIIRFGEPVRRAVFTAYLSSEPCDG